MKANPLVTYIIPSYNHALYIEQAIESVLQQTYKPIELIIVDDGSKDNTKEILMKYSNHPNIQIIFNEVNLRQSATVNKALKLAKGEFIGLLPSDDWILPTKTELQINKFLKSEKDVGVIYAKGARFFEDSCDSEIIETEYLMHRGFITKKLVEQGNFIYPVTPLFKKECFVKYPFDESYTAEGEAIYLKLSLTYKFDYVDEVVGIMRDHIGNTGKMTDIMFEENIRYMKDFFNRQDLPDEIKALKDKRLGHICKVKFMESIVSNRNYKKGIKIALQALRYNVFYIFNLKFLFCFVLSYMPSFISNFILNIFYVQKRNY